MKSLSIFSAATLTLCMFLCGFAGANTANTRDKNSTESVAAGLAAPEIPAKTNDSRISGEQRFHSNCGRCHAAPPKFPPRMMATIVRHMRVRATLTDADMRLILGYMTK